MILGAIAAGLLVAAVLGFGMGFGAASWFTSVAGPREGAAAMSGFFLFGPIGAVAGLLLGSGIVVRFWSAAHTAGGWLLGSGGAVLLFGVVLMLVSANPRRQPLFDVAPVMEFELDFPEPMLGEGPIQDVRWTPSRAEHRDGVVSQFWEKRCQNGRCVVNGSSYVLSTRQSSTLTVDLRGRLLYFHLNLPPKLEGALPWSEWDEQDGVRVRWRTRSKEKTGG